MPETVPGISFNHDGICSFCQNYQKEMYLGKYELDRLIDLVKSKKNKYDCIVPLSGGRDSSFILYLARVRYNLKVLAVSYDNEFRNDQALTNMNRACNILNSDFISVRSKMSIAHKIVKNNIRSSVMFGEFGTCYACEYGYRSVVYRAAEEYEVPLILWGESQQEKTRDMEETARAKAFKGLNPKIPKLSRLLNACFYKAEYFKLLQRLEFRVPGNSILSRKYPVLKNGNITEVRVFDYLPWDRNEIKEVIMGKLNWQKPPDHISTWRTDCTLHTLVNYSFYRLFGCSKDCFGYCKMINSGQMDRHEALKQEEEMAMSFDENIKELLEHKIGLSKKEASEIMSFETKGGSCTSDFSGRS
jgi:tRNA(Ile)-lysidine synthase TilS/MesJ